MIRCATFPRSPRSATCRPCQARRRADDHAAGGFRRAHRKRSVACGDACQGSQDSNAIMGPMGREVAMARIGFIGLGNMGLPMATNLLKAGHQVEGVDVNPAAIEKLRAAGGAADETAKVAAARADVVITMLPSGK